jgi:pilus assembly protein CpaF
MEGQTQNSVWNLLTELGTKKGITEIVINGPKLVFVERQGQFIQLNVNLTKNDLYEFIGEVATFNKKECSSDTPILDGNLPDGSRINAIVEPFCSGSPAISIRKYLKSISTFEGSPGVFGLAPNWVTLLKGMVAARSNIIISGGTGVGKTTFMNLLLHEINPAERIVAIEDTLELTVDLPNVVRLESGARTNSSANIGVRDLVKNTLRMRPDRIIIGEVRGGELFDLLQAMNTGHDGSMSSVHSSSPAECLNRLETLFLLAGYDVPSQVVKRQIGSAVDFIIQLGRDREGQRLVTQIFEVTGMDGTNIITQIIADASEEGILTATGIAPKCMSRLHLDGGLPMNFFNKF